MINLMHNKSWPPIQIQEKYIQTHLHRFVTLFLYFPKKIRHLIHRSDSIQGTDYIATEATFPLKGEGGTREELPGASPVSCCQAAPPVVCVRVSVEFTVVCTHEPLLVMINNVPHGVEQSSLFCSIFSWVCDGAVDQ